MYITQGLHRGVQQTPRRDRHDLRRTARAPSPSSATASPGWPARCSGLGVEAATAPRSCRSTPTATTSSSLAMPWAGGVVDPGQHCAGAPPRSPSRSTRSDARVLVVDDAFAGHGRPASARPRPQLEHGHPRRRRRRTPDGTLAFEELIAGHEPMADARRGGDEPGRPSSTPAAPPASPRASCSATPTCSPRRWASLASEHFLQPGGTYLHAAPMFHLADLAAWTGAARPRRHARRSIPMFEPVAVDDRDRRARRHRRPARAHDDPAAGRPPRASTSSTSAACGGSSTAPRRSSEARAQPGGQGAAQRDVHAGLRHDRALARAPRCCCRADHERPGAPALGRPRRRCTARCASSTPDDVEVPRGTVGEICARGGHVMLGYWNRPEETAAGLRGGWMHTGDGGYMDDDGYVYIVDRIKDMIITGGENVYSVEVENALAQHPAVATCAVIGVPDDEWGERVHAVVVPVRRRARRHRRGAARRSARERIAGYKTPALDGVRRRPAAVGRRQGAQARAAGALLGGHRPKRRR